MTGIKDTLQILGGLCLALGLMLLGLSGFQPKWGGLTDLLQNDLLQNTATLSELGFSATVAGILLTILYSTLSRRRRTSVAVDHTHNVHKSASAGKSTALLDPIPALGTQRRVCLKPVWPQRKTAHWIGGLPELPHDAHWPQINGKPATFLAQIGLVGLPSTLWQGVGPRTGALVFFGDGDTDSDVVVLHVDGAVQPRAQPSGVNYRQMTPTSFQGLRYALGTQADLPPKWYLDISDPDTLGAVEDMAAENDAFWDGERGCWIWEAQVGSEVRVDLSKPELRNGSTWDTPLAILGALRAALEDEARNLAYMIQHHPERMKALETEIAKLTQLASGEGEEAIKAKTTLLKKINTQERLIAQHPKEVLGARIIAKKLEETVSLMQSVHATAQLAPYDPSVASELHAFSSGVQTELRTKAGVVLAGPQFTFADIMEGLARHAYCKDPDLLHPDLFALYEKRWAHECANTAIFLGTNSDMVSCAINALRLLDLPSNALTGISIGDVSRFYCDIPAAALNAGDLSGAQGDNTHGTY